MSTGSGYCVKCGSQLVEGADFCAKCGAPVGRAPVLAPPPGMAPVPPATRRRGLEKKWIIWLGVLLLACAFFNGLRGGSDSEAAKAPTIAFEGTLSKIVRVDEGGEMTITVRNTGDVALRSLAIYVPGSVRQGMLSLESTDCEFHEAGPSGRTFFCGTLPSGLSRNIRMTYKTPLPGYYSGSILIADQTNPGKLATEPSNAETLGRLTTSFTVR